MDEGEAVHLSALFGSHPATAAEFCGRWCHELYRPPSSPTSAAADDATDITASGGLGCRGPSSGSPCPRRSLVQPESPGVDVDPPDPPLIPKVAFRFLRSWNRTVLSPESLKPRPPGIPTPTALARPLKSLTLKLVKKPYGTSQHSLEPCNPMDPGRRTLKVVLKLNTPCTSPTLDPFELS